MFCNLEDENLCIECCKWMTFIVKIEPQNFKKYMEFYKARGCKVEKFTDSVVINVPSYCPHLTITGCLIYEDRPELCKEYNCKEDPFLKGGKYYGKKIKDNYQTKICQKKEYSDSKEEKESRL